MLKQVALLTISAIVFSACTSKPSESVQEPVSETSNTNTEPDAYAGVAAALQAGGSASCTLTKKDGSSQILYHAKKDKVSVTGITSDTQAGTEPSSMLMDGTYVYTWNETTKEGVKFPVPDPEDVQQAQNQAPSIPDFSEETAREEYLADGYEIDCQVAEVPDAVFTPPSDVTFTDMSAMMENAQKMMEQYGQQ